MAQDAGRLDGDRASKEDWAGLLELVVSRFEEQELAPFLNFGTLLGAVRDGAFIPWDSDIDLGLVEGEDSVGRLRRAAEGLVAKGCRMIVCKEAIYIRRNGVKVGVRRYRYEPVRDAFVSRQLGRSGRRRPRTRKLLVWLAYGYQFGVYPPQDKASLKRKAATWCVARMAGRPLLCSPLVSNLSSAVDARMMAYVVPRRFLTELDKLRFYGNLYRVPRDPEGYLKMQYGPDWVTPQREWDYIEDSRSLVDPVKPKVERDPQGDHP